MLYCHIIQRCADHTFRTVRLYSNGSAATVMATSHVWSARGWVLCSTTTSRAGGWKEELAMHFQLSLMSFIVILFLLLSFYSVAYSLVHLFSAMYPQRQWHASTCLSVKVVRVANYKIAEQPWHIEYSRRRELRPKPRLGRSLRCKTCVSGFVALLCCA